MSNYTFTWNYGSNQTIAFDPKNDNLDLGWLTSSQVTFEEKDGAVVISLPSNHQTLTLTGISLADLNLTNVTAYSQDMVNVFSPSSDTPADSGSGSDNTPSDSGSGSGSDDTPSDSGSGTSPSGSGSDTPDSGNNDSHTYQLTWKWGSNDVVAFNPQTDKLDLGWLSSSQVTVEEKNGSVVFSFASNNQTLTLTDVTLDELNLNNIIALDQSMQSVFNHDSGGGTSGGGDSGGGTSGGGDSGGGTSGGGDSGGGTSGGGDSGGGTSGGGDSGGGTSGGGDSGGGTSGGGDAGTVYTVGGNWNAHDVINFDPTKDTLDFGWKTSGEFTISEVDGSVVIKFTGMGDETLTLKGVSLDDMSFLNIQAKDDTAKQAWMDALHITRDDLPAPVIHINPDAPAMPTAYEYTPYVDMTSWPTPDLVKYVEQSGVKDFTLAFMVANPEGQLSWGGYYNMDQDGPTGADYTFKQEITAVQNAGGHITVSFGGANGEEMAIVASREGKDAASLAATYQTGIDKYHLDSIDFDIEGSALPNKTANDLRNQALAILEKNNPNLHVSYTLPVLEDGLTQDDIALLENAKDRGVKVDIVNIMAMDYGHDVSDMGQAAIDAATNTYNQMQSIGMTASKVGVTPMIGVNDVPNETFTLEDANRLAAFAASHTDMIGRVSEWSMTRDVAGKDTGQATAANSGVAQNDYDFSHTLMGA